MHEVSLSGQHTNTYSDTVISELMHHTDGLKWGGSREKVEVTVGHKSCNGKWLRLQLFGTSVQNLSCSKQNSVQTRFYNLTTVTIVMYSFTNHKAKTK